MSSFNKDKYIPGDYYVTCDSCGSKVRASQTRMQWNNMRVCASEWNAKPWELLPAKRYPEEGKSVKNARPPSTDTFKSETALPDTGNL